LLLALSTLLFGLLSSGVALNLLLSASVFVLLFDLLTVILRLLLFLLLFFVRFVAIPLSAGLRAAAQNQRYGEHRRQ